MVDKTIDSVKYFKLHTAYERYFFKRASYSQKSLEHDCEKSMLAMKKPLKCFLFSLMVSIR